MGLYLEEKQIFVLMFKANFLRLGVVSYLFRKKKDEGIWTSRTQDMG